MRQQLGRNNNQNRSANNAEELAAAQEQQMQEALENRAELTSLLQALQQSPGVTAQQTDLLRQRLARSNEQIELLQNQNQQRAMGRDGLSADDVTATANASNSNKQYFRIGETLLEVTQIGKECHADCAIRQQVGDCVMPREGIFAIVLEEGSVKAGDTIEVL